MLVAIDEVGRAAEQFLERRQLHHQFGADDFRIEFAQQPGAQQFWKRQEHAAVDRLEVHGQRPERRRQRDVQADRAARAFACRLLQGCDLVAADRRRHHHHRGGVEAAALDQVANGAVDAGADTVIVGAQPDPARRRGIVHSAAVRSMLSAAPGSARFSLCSATK